MNDRLLYVKRMPLQDAVAVGEKPKAAIPLVVGETPITFAIADGLLYLLVIYTEASAQRHSANTYAPAFRGNNHA